MEFIYETEGTCASHIKFDIEDNRIYNLEFIGGCNGNLKAISKVCEGMTVDEIEKQFAGITCGRKPTSCTDQLAKAVRAATK